MKDPSIFLEHILENINDIENFMRNVKKEDFIKNKEKQKAVIKSIEIIGEASKNLPQSFKEKNKGIPWKEIIGTRDKMSHHYFGVDLDLIWGVIKEKLPQLKREIKKIRDNLIKS